MRTDTLSLEDFIREAEQGNHAWVNKHLTERVIDIGTLRWATITGRHSDNNDIRMLAAKCLAVSGRALGVSVTSELKAWMLAEAHAPAQYLLATALYRRGSTDAKVIELYDLALKDAVVGRDARAYGHAPA